jgi:hypothetical protein
MRRMTFVGLGLFLAVLAAPAAFGEGKDTLEMYGVEWQPTLDHAVAAASPSGGASKPIVWFRVLGDLDGLT